MAMESKLQGPIHPIRETENAMMTSPNGNAWFTEAGSTAGSTAGGALLGGAAAGISGAVIGGAVGLVAGFVSANSHHSVKQK